MSAHIKSDQLLDLSGEVIPFSLALCKATLAHLPPGTVVEIHLRDYETLQDLLIIMERCGEQVLAWERQAGRCALWVQKSPGC